MERNTPSLFRHGANREVHGTLLTPMRRTKVLGVVALDAPASGCARQPCPLDSTVSVSRPTDATEAELQPASCVDRRDVSRVVMLFESQSCT